MTLLSKLTHLESLAQEHSIDHKPTMTVDVDTVIEICAALRRELSKDRGGSYSVFGTEEQRNDPDFHLPMSDF